MNRIDYLKPGNIEKKILKTLSERDSLDFMSLRASFPISITSIEKRCNDLLSLGLIRKDRLDDETIYFITDQGSKVITQGFDNWIKFKIFNEIKNEPYVITKSTPSIERSTVRVLESEGKIYLDGNLYKVVPGQKLKSQKANIDIPSDNLNGIIDKVINDIYTMKIPFHHMAMEKTHKHEIRHVMNYLEENKIVEINSDPLKLTALGFHIYHIGHDKWRKEKDREELIGEKIKNGHLKKKLDEKPNKNWKNKVNDWYSENEKIINIIVAAITVMGFVMAVF